jgi:hypothetical protein
VILAGQNFDIAFILLNKRERAMTADIVESIYGALAILTKKE